jgi:hypothetical protein
MYEWVLTGGLLLLTFILVTLVTYVFTKNWTFNKLLSITYVGSSLLYIILIFVLSLFIENISYIFIIPLFLIFILTTINWLPFIGYYKANSKSKSFSLAKLLEEFKKDSIRNIIILTIAIIAISIFLRGDLLYIFIITYIDTSLSIYLCTILAGKFIHD